MPQSMRRVIIDAESERLEGDILWPSRLPIMATSPSRRSHMTPTLR